MDELPNEILTKIIYLLPTKEIIRYKLVNKKWHSVIDSIIKVKCLVLCDYLPIRERWYTTSDPVDVEDAIKINYRNLDLIATKLEQAIFSNLSRLLLANIYDKFLVIDFLNHLKQLEHLQFANLKFQSKDRSCTLELHRLKVLSVDNVSIRNLVNFDSCSLTKVRFDLNDNSMKKIKFNHLESIRLLEMNKYNNCASMFVNLEYFFCFSMKRVDLTKWPNLKEIQFYQDETVWNDLRKQKAELQMDGLKIYFFGLELDRLPSNKIQTYLFNHYIKPETIQLYGENLNRLARMLPFIKNLSYNELEDLSGELPDISDFIKRFVNLTCLIVFKRINNLSLFYDLLKYCTNLISLELRASALEQRFFDDLLPELCPNLVALRIEKEHSLDFKFLDKFRKIQEFSTDQTLPIHFVCRTIRSKKFEEFTFNHDGIKLSACCSESINEFKLVINEVNHYLDTFDDLISRLNSM